MRGKISSFNCERGYGFLETKKGEFFGFTYRDLLEGVNFVEPGDEVEFEFKSSPTRGIVPTKIRLVKE